MSKHPPADIALLAPRILGPAALQAFRKLDPRAPGAQPGDLHHRRGLGAGDAFWWCAKP